MIVWTLFLSSSLAGPSDLPEVLHRALAAHEPARCEGLFDLGSAEVVRDGLLELTDPDILPPAVPMRAVACLLSQRPDDALVQRAAAGWVSDPSTPGLALVVAHHLDRVPPGPAASLGQALVERLAVEPRLALHLRPVLRASAHPRVVELERTAP